MSVPCTALIPVTSTTSGFASAGPVAKAARAAKRAKRAKAVAG
jgi:hypothetical protein